MKGSSYHYTFAEAVPTAEAELTLLLALLGVEALHGESQTRLDARHAFNGPERTVTIDAATAVGRDWNKLFAGYLAAEFGAGSFTIRPAGHVPQPKSQPEVVTA
jgi:hypothetical protein